MRRGAASRLRLLCCGNHRRRARRRRRIVARRAVRTRQVRSRRLEDVELSVERRAAKLDPDPEHQRRARCADGLLPARGHHALRDDGHGREGRRRRSRHEGNCDVHLRGELEHESGKLILGRGESELFISKFSATKDGRTFTVPGPGATTRRTPAGETPYTCRGDTLRWKIPLNDTWTLFRRVD